MDPYKNYIFLVEDFSYRIEYEDYQPSEDEIKRIGEVLGQPTKKLDVVKQRIRDVFTKYIVKRCVDLPEKKSVCIYTINPRTPFRPYPIVMHATGTIVLFEDEKPTKLLAFPMHKVLSYAKSPGLDPAKYGDEVPIEVTKRIDGWQMTAYFNPVLNRWIFATRYVLHNMYFESGRLVTEDFENVANPYVYVATKLAEEMGLFEKLKGYEGWTFTFVLEGPEPAVTKPPYPLGSDYNRYRLYLLFARDPEGKLYTWSQSRELLKFDTPPAVEPKALRDLYEEVRRSLVVRSYVAYIRTDDPVNPILAELESDLYPDAMNVKYLYDAKSASILVFEDVVDELLNIVDERIKDRILSLRTRIKELVEVLNSLTGREDLESIAKSISSALKELGIQITWGEIKKSLEQKNIVRIAKKIVSLLLEGKSLLTPVDEEVQEVLSKIRGCITS